MLGDAKGSDHVFGRYARAIAIGVSRKMDQTPDFAVLLSLGAYAAGGIGYKYEGSP